VHRLGLNLDKRFKKTVSNLFQRTILPFEALVWVEVKVNMNVKLIAALVIVGVLAVTLVGLVAAQIAISNPSGTTANASTNSGFFGWMGRCFGLRNAQYSGTQSPAYRNQPENITVTCPNTYTPATIQGYCGYGRCMGLP
jgi:hypothetical protein